MTHHEGACLDALEGLEDIDDDFDKIGVAFVLIRDEDYPFKEHAIQTFPSLGLYRNGQFLQYELSLADRDAVRKWIMDTDTLRLPGKIEEVNGKMLDFLYEEVDNLVVFFYGTAQFQ